MINPSMSSLLKKVDNRFMLCTITSMRARQLIDGAQKLIDCESGNAVTIAINEIDKNKITFIRKKSSIR